MPTDPDQIEYRTGSQLSTLPTSSAFPQGPRFGDRRASVLSAWIHHFNRIQSKIPVLLCVGVLGGIIVAGLAPFQSPRNEVHWLANANGVRFGKHGTILSSGAFQMAGTEGEASSSIEIWLEPDRTEFSGTILAFSTPRNPLRFSLQQYTSTLILKRKILGRKNQNIMAGTEGIFHKGRAVFITITSGAQQSALYVDGALMSTFPQFRLGKDFTGQLVLATSPVANDNWRGGLSGLAIYHSELTPEQVLQHFSSWTKKGHLQLAERERAVALYVFNEHAGSVVHNAISGWPNLYIPQRYMLLHQVFLEPFWEEHEANWSHWKDILVNIVGFIPLGFVFFAYWSSVRPIRRAALVTLVLGFAVSITIEVLQSSLPTRNSGTTDLITNTLGTFLGVQLYGWRVARTLLAWVYEPLSNSPSHFCAAPCTSLRRRDV
jgi:VanZ family protein